MKVNQIYTLVNSIYQQMTGQDDISVVDNSGIISMGQTVLSTEANKDNFLNILADRIGRVDIRTLDLELEYPNLMKNSFEFGAILQKINVQPFLAKSQNAWNVGKNDFTPSLYNIDKPVVSQTFFTGSNAWEFDVTIPDTMLKTAFTSASAMGTFIDAIMSAIIDSMTMALNNMAQNCINNFIAEKIKASNGVVQLISGYNAINDTTFTSADADELITDPSFLKYCGMIMRNYIKYLSKPSVLYNAGGMVRATARDNMHVLISSDLASAYATYLTADTFHNELTALPNYKEYVTLQGTGDDVPNFENNTTINVIPSSEEGEEDPTAIEKSYIVGIFADREAIAIGLDDRFTATDRSNRDRITNYTSGATIQYINDVSENGVVFIME